MAITEAALDRKTAAQERMLGMFASQARSLIASKFDDARAHASLAITPTMKARPGGRTTLAALRSHPSFQAAKARLLELRADLTDLIRQARAELLALSVTEWARLIPETVTGAGPHQPSQDLTAKVRAMVLYGHTIEFFLSGPFERSAGRLLAASERAANELVKFRESRDSLTVWKRQETEAISTASIQLLATSLTAIDVVAGRSLIPDDQLEPFEGAVYGWS